MKDLCLEHKAAVLLGMKEGNEKVDQYIASEGTDFWCEISLRKTRRIKPGWLLSCDKDCCNTCFASTVTSGFKLHDLARVP